MKKIGLALGGGGARGLCQIPFLEAMDELGAQPSIISGTSMGAIIGAMYASGLSGADLCKLLDTIGIKEICKRIVTAGIRCSVLFGFGSSPMSRCRTITNVQG